MITVAGDKLIKTLQEAQRALYPQDKAMLRAFVRIGTLTQSAIIEQILQWKQAGHLYQRGGLINSIKYEVLPNGVRVFSAGIPYARIHEFGTQGKGGLLPDVVPRRRKWLTIPLGRDYERVRPRTLKLEFVKDDKNRAWLWDLRKKRLAYRLVKKVSIPARPYFFPAIAKTTTRRLQILREAMAIWG